MSPEIDQAARSVFAGGKPELRRPRPPINERITKQMNLAAKRVCGLLVNSASQNHQLQQWRGIRLKVRDGNLDRALALVGHKMQLSGIERMIKNEQTHRIKESEKRVLARKRLQIKLRSDDYADKLYSILMQKARGV